MRDPYKILGLSPDADSAAIKAAYRKLAKELHPDSTNRSEASKARFQEVTAAYNQLKEGAKSSHPQSGRKPNSSFEAADNFTASSTPDARDALFSELFQGIRSAGKRVFRARGEDQTFHLSISFLEAANGVVRRVTMPGGKTLDVTIPAGIESGKQIRLRGQGGDGHGGAEAGDALILVDVGTHTVFHRDGDDIYLTLPITLREAVLGAKIDIPTISGPISLTIPPGSNTGIRLRIKERGIKNPSNSAAGNQYVTLSVMLPEQPDAALRDFLKDWEGANYHPRKSFSDMN